LEQQGTHDVVNGAKSTFGFTILLRHVWTRHAECNAVGEEKKASSGVIKLATIVALNTADSCRKLGANTSEKM
jgi:hypothetical protein